MRQSCEQRKILDNNFNIINNVNNKSFTSLRNLILRAVGIKESSVYIFVKRQSRIYPCNTDDMKL